MRAQLQLHVIVQFKYKHISGVQMHSPRPIHAFVHQAPQQALLSSRQRFAGEFHPGARLARLATPAPLTKPKRKPLVMAQSCIVWLSSGRHLFHSGHVCAAAPEGASCLVLTCRDVPVTVEGMLHGRLHASSQAAESGSTDASRPCSISCARATWTTTTGLDVARATSKPQLRDVAEAPSAQAATVAHITQALKVCYHDVS